MGHMYCWEHVVESQSSFLIAIHCVVHRLALAAGQAANEIPHLIVAYP